MILSLTLILLKDFRSFNEIFLIKTDPEKFSDSLYISPEKGSMITK